MLTEEEKEELKLELSQPSTLIRLPLGRIDEALDFIKSQIAAKKERFHPLVLINGDPKIGEGTKIGIFSEIFDKAGIVQIGADCDIGSFVAINCADSSAKATNRSDSIRTSPITIDDACFIGSHSFIGPGTHLGRGCVVAAGTIIRGNRNYPPFSLVWGNPARVKKGYYRGKTRLAASIPESDGR